jgi:phosphatidylglycerol:prolipoprotein diacylglycerol transferase
MLMHPQFDPVAIALGPVQIHWYGLTYLVAFGLWFVLAAARTRHPTFARAGWTRRDVEDLLFYAVVGLIIGGRLGYALLYKPAHYLQNPLEMLMLWQGGMSFHGGLLGVIAAMAWFGRSRGRDFLQVADFVAPAVPLGLASGRLGNFINGELWGHVTTSPLGIVFPDAGPYPRHPSMLYEGVLEGIVLAIILWAIHRRQRHYGVVSAVFLLGYGVFRFAVEFFRVPDAQLGYFFGGITMGQILCVIMVLLSGVLYTLARKANVPNPLYRG